MKKILILLSALLISFWGCDNTTEITPIVKINKAVIVVSEGGFAQNNSSVTTYSIEEKSAQNDIYFSANSSALGDTGNDLVIVENNGFIAVTGSNKIEIVNMDNFKSVGNIDFTDFGGPRKIAISGNTGYATTSNSMLVKFDLSTFAVLDTLTIGFKPEGIVSAEGKLFIAISGWGAGTTVSVVDETTFQVIRDISVKINPTNIVSLGNDVFVISTGTYAFAGGDGMGMVTKIDATSLTVLDTLQIVKNPGRVALGNDEELFLINGDGIVHIGGATMSIIANTLVSAAAVNDISFSIYSVGFDKDNDLLYLGNPKDFAQNGDIAIFNLSGTEEGRFDVGINPGTIVFKK